MTMKKQHNETQHTDREEHTGAMPKKQQNVAPPGTDADKDTDPPHKNKLENSPDNTGRRNPPRQDNNNSGNE